MISKRRVRRDRKQSHKYTLFIEDRVEESGFSRVIVSSPPLWRKVILGNEQILPQEIIEPLNHQGKMGHWCGFSLREVYEKHFKTLKWECSI